MHFRIQQAGLYGGRVNAQTTNIQNQSKLKRNVTRTGTANQALRLLPRAALAARKQIQHLIRNSWGSPLRLPRFREYAYGPSVRRTGTQEGDTDISGGSPAPRQGRSQPLTVTFT